MRVNKSIKYRQVLILARDKGVMVIIDYINRTIYTALSLHCDRELLEDYAQRIGYEQGGSFQIILLSGQPIYHINVGTAFA